MGSRDGSSGNLPARPGKTRLEKPAQGPGELPDMGREGEFTEIQVQLADAADLDFGTGDSREDLETDGPVMGGPGMALLGGGPSPGAGRIQKGPGRRSDRKEKGGIPWIGTEIART